MARVLTPAMKLGEMALDFLFPKRCVGCGGEGDFICPRCLRAFQAIPIPLCPRCGRPQLSGVVCPDCVAWQANITGIRSPYKFDGVLRQAVHSLKYHNLRAMAPPLASLLADYLSANPIPADVLVPVPLHSRRLRERGYNQSALIARELGKLTGLAVVTDCLVRAHYALPQARTANVAERRRNVTAAFACRSQALLGRQVLLIDDVSTSGATLDACAAAALEAGAISVWGLTVAREI